jgi:hypothetical protein
MPPLNAKVADTAPEKPTLTPYDEQHAVTYVRLLDAEKAGADWQEIASIVLHIDPVSEPIGLAVPMIVTWLAQNGWRATVIVSFSVVESQRIEW